MITPAERLRPRARAGAALLAAVAGLLLLAGSVSHLRPAHVVSASGASSEDVSVNGAAVTGSGAAVAGSVIVSGPCVVDNDCLYSDNYQRTTEGEYEPVGEYSNSGYCLVKNLPAASFLTVHAFHTEFLYDFITVDGITFSGNGLGLNGRVAKAGTIAWHSDRSRTGAGFKICWSPAPPPSPPSPPPPPPAAPAPPSSPPSLAKQLLLALEQGPVATDLEQLLEEHPQVGQEDPPEGEHGDQGPLDFDACGNISAKRVFDVQWSGDESLAVQQCWGFSAPYKPNEGRLTVDREHDYFRLHMGPDGAQALQHFGRDGHLKAELSGGVVRLGSEEVIFYIIDGWFGTVITRSETYSDGDQATFANLMRDPVLGGCTPRQLGEQDASMDSGRRSKPGALVLLL